MEDLILNNNEVILCRGKGCCPRLQKVDEGQVLITDDEGNKMVLTTEQALLIPEAISLLDD